MLILITYFRLAIVRDMTAAGLGLNKFCYAGLIAAHKNKKPLTDDTTTKVFFATLHVSVVYVCPSPID